MLKVNKIFTFVFVVLLAFIIAVPVLASTYIGNRNTGKFHYANCRFVSEMNPDNQIEINSRDEAIASGYIPCKRCNP